MAEYVVLIISIDVTNDVSQIRVGTTMPRSKKYHTRQKQKRCKQARMKNKAADMLRSGEITPTSKTSDITMSERSLWRIKATLKVDPTHAYTEDEVKPGPKRALPREFELSFIDVITHRGALETSMTPAAIRSLVIPYAIFWRSAHGSTSLTLPESWLINGAASEEWFGRCIK